MLRYQTIFLYSVIFYTILFIRMCFDAVYYPVHFTFLFNLSNNSLSNIITLYILRHGEI